MAGDNHETQVLQQRGRDAEHSGTPLPSEAGSDDRYRLLFENMTSGFALHEVICDDQGRGIDYRFLEVNPAYERLTGLKAKDLVGKTVREVLPNIEDYWVEKFCSVALTREPVSYENYVKELDRYYDTFAFCPKPGQFAVVFYEVTERRRMEKALAESERRYRELVETLLEGIWVVDAEARTTFVNPSMAAILGYTGDEMLGRHLFDFVAEDRRAECATYLERRREGIAEQHEFTFRRKDGSECLALVAASPLTDQDGGFAGVIAGVQDVTERIKAREEKEAFDRKLLETQKLESLGVLAGGIAHDFNNILSGILGNANLARLDLQPSSVVHPYLEQIETAAVRAADLCKQMLAYSGRGRFVVGRLCINEIIEDTLQLLQLSISKNAVLKLQLTKPLPPVSADATQMRQLVMNLVINASEAIGGRSGVILVATGLVHADREYLKKLRLRSDIPPGDYVFLEVGDNGCGMSGETLSRIFDPFFSTKFSGRGLGLSAVLGIVQGHRGGIRIYSEPGRGTTFKILLPAVEGEAEKHQKPISPGSAWRGEGTVLVVDDEDTVRTLLARALRRFGFEAVLASNGTEAAEHLAANPDRFRCVLLDLTMPHLDGEATFRELRRINDCLPVILMSGFNEHEAVSRFAGKGLAGFLQKPFQIESLRRVLSQVAG